MNLMKRCSLFLAVAAACSMSAQAMPVNFSTNVQTEVRQAQATSPVQGNPLASLQKYTVSHWLKGRGRTAHCVVGGMQSLVGTWISVAGLLMIVITICPESWSGKEMCLEDKIILRTAAVFLSMGMGIPNMIYGAQKLKHGIFGKKEEAKVVIKNEFN